MLGGVSRVRSVPWICTRSFFWCDCGEEGVFKFSRCIAGLGVAIARLLEAERGGMVWHGIPRSLGFRQIGWRVTVPCNCLVRWTILDRGARVAKNGSWDLAGTRYSGGKTRQTIVVVVE